MAPLHLTNAIAPYEDIPRGYAGDPPLVLYEYYAREDINAQALGIKPGDRATSAVSKAQS